MNSAHTAIAFSTLMSAIGVCNAADDHTRKWLERPWETRYIVFFAPKGAMRDNIQIASNWNRRNEWRANELSYFFAMALFRQEPETRAARSLPVDKLLLIFDRDGRVTSTSLKSPMWVAKRNVLDTIVLINTTRPQAKPYNLADWSQGIPGDMTFSPAICSGWDSHRYTDDWGLDDRFGSFGCREWTAQLYRWEQPYIDVTSYSNRGPFIGEFVGWARFSDPPKPVIGLQRTRWFCLHECPDGERPGLIKDIGKWTTKHGFPMPTRPPKQPLYPDSNYKEDLNELSD